MTEDEALSKVEKLKAKKAALDAEIKRAEAAERKKARKEDTRRKIVVGGALLAHAELKPEFRDYMAKVLDKAVTRPVDRKLLGLPDPKPEPQPVARTSFEVDAGRTFPSS